MRDQQAALALTRWGVYPQHARVRQHLEKVRSQQIRQISGLSQWTCLLSGGSSTINLTTMPGLYVQPDLNLLSLLARAFTSKSHEMLFCKYVTVVPANGCVVCVRPCHFWVTHMQLESVEKQNIDISKLHKCLSAQLARAEDNVAFYPRSCPSEGARLCTYCGALIVLLTIR